MPSAALPPDSGPWNARVTELVPPVLVPPLLLLLQPASATTATMIGAATLTRNFLFTRVLPAWHHRRLSPAVRSCHPGRRQPSAFVSPEERPIPCRDRE